MRISEAKKLVRENWYYVTFFIIILGIYSRFGPISDDNYYPDLLSRFGGDKLAVLRDFYQNWGGRTPSIAIRLLMAEHNIWWFRAVSSMLWTVLLLSLQVLMNGHKASQTNKALLALCTFGVFFTLPFNVLFGGSFWASGAVVYLYPLVALLVALVPIIKLLTNDVIERKWESIPYFIAGGFAAYSEQTGLILITMIVFAIIYLRKQGKAVKWLSVFLIFILINLFVSMSAPGNSIRLQGELYWYTNFDMLSTFDKIIQGSVAVTTQLINRSYILILLSLAVAIKLFSNGQSKLDALLRIVPLGYFIYARYFSNTLSILSLETISGTVLLPSMYFDTIILFALVIYLGYLVFDSFVDRIYGLFCSLLYFISLAVGAIIGFSPTVLASGDRVFFVTNSLLCVIAIVLLSHFASFPRNTWTYKLSVFAMYVVTAIGLLVAWQYFLGTNLPIPQG